MRHFVIFIGIPIRKQEPQSKKQKNAVPRVFCRHLFPQSLCLFPFSSTPSTSSMKCFFFVVVISIVDTHTHKHNDTWKSTQLWVKRCDASATQTRKNRRIYSDPLFVCCVARHMSCQMCVIDLCESLKGVFSACVSYRFINTKCFED